MEKDVTISARVTSAIAIQIDVLSKQYGRSRSWLMQNAIQSYVAQEMEFAKAVQEGLDDIRAGRVVSHEDVLADWEKFKAEHGVK